MKIQDLVPAGLAFLVAAIVLSIGADVLSGATDKFAVPPNQVLNNSARDAIRNGSEALNELGSWFPTIGLVVAASVIIGTVVAYFAFNKQ